MAKDRVTLQQATLVDDGVGGFTKTWTDLATVWAWVKPLVYWRGVELFQSQELQAKMRSQVTIRYRSDIADTEVAAKLRVVLGSRTMNVQGVQNLREDMKSEGKIYQSLVCVEGDPA
jgi:SPP1 family predicted phage head-tail adaptor